MDDLPPLDDASELVDKIKSRHAEKKVSEVSRDLLNFELNDEKYIPELIKTDLEPKKKTSDNSTTKKIQPKRNTKNKKASGFGGFGSGFLFGGKPKTQKKAKEEIEEIITPKARESIKNENPLILPEVQEQMNKELQDENFLGSYGTLYL